MIPAELAEGLALLARAIDGQVLDEERAVAQDVLREIRGLLRDVRSGADDVLLGRQTPVIKPALTLMKLQCAQPPGALDGILRWVEDQAGTRGRRRQDFALVTDDGSWSEVWRVWAHRPPLPLAGRPGPCPTCTPVARDLTPAVR